MNYCFLYFLITLGLPIAWGLYCAATKPNGAVVSNKDDVAAVDMLIDLGYDKQQAKERVAFARNQCGDCDFDTLVNVALRADEQGF